MFLRIRVFAILVVSLLLISCAPSGETHSSVETTSAWEMLSPDGSPTARHEASAVAYKDKLYLIGGRRVNPVDVYDPATNSWSVKSDTPIELHHFQSVVVDDAVYLMGAMTGGWPNEKPLEKVMAYYPDEDRYEQIHDIPEARRRGGAGVVYHNSKIYMVGGITNGHMNGYVNWFDEYDPKTGEWRVLPDAPHKRDHFVATVVDNKLYAMAGRKTEHAAGNDFGPTYSYADVFNFETEAWEPLDEALNLPTGRAGNMITTWKTEIIVGGGESEHQVPAHNEVEAFDTVSRTWRNWPSLNEGRHGSAFVEIDGYLYTASGCGKRGGDPELTSIERLKLPMKPYKSAALTVPKRDQKKTEVYRQWHSVTLNFEGPETSEIADVNPFADYRLLVEITSGDQSYLIRGFYAADGNAAQTSAQAGNIWQVRFTPPSDGEWTYKAALKTGRNIATSRDPRTGAGVAITNASGKFTVLPSNKSAPDFRAPQRGLLTHDNGYYRFQNSGRYWLKGGPNSPENLLGYVGFDDTYRIEDEVRDGEARAGGAIHSFEPHLKDWRPGDPVWADGKGKSIIGAMNYIADEGMNTAYFLTLNILGDGKDVWPYVTPEDFTRFDVSKLEQWNILFDHMQSKGILLHIVTQETENELMLDGGDTGPLRALYYSELIARFAHHPALVWNLGEENGPVHWRPEGQNNAQRKAMTKYLMAHDPYNHPILLHTHSQASEKDDIAGPLLGFKPLDGLSFQVADRETVNAETQKWRKLSREAGSEWVITMDEIGQWYMGAAPDAMDPRHDSLRRHALWGHLMGGGAGVEWYFGARFPGNDLSVEDWRTRENLWGQTHNALAFFEAYLPYWEMESCNGLIDRSESYCFGKEGEVYAIYLPEGGTGFVNLPKGHDYKLSWYDPVVGGAVRTGNVANVIGGDRIEVGLPPSPSGEDQILLIQKN